MKARAGPHSPGMTIFLFLNPACPTFHVRLFCQQNIVINHSAAQHVAVDRGPLVASTAFTHLFHSTSLPQCSVVFCVKNRYSCQLPHRRIRWHSPSPFSRELSRTVCLHTLVTHKMGIKTEFHPSSSTKLFVVSGALPCCRATLPGWVKNVFRAKSRNL